MKAARVKSGHVTILARTWDELTKMVCADDGEFDFTAASYEDVVRMYSNACWRTNSPGAVRLLDQVRAGLVPCLLTRREALSRGEYDDYIDFGDGRISICEWTARDIVLKMYDNIKLLGTPHPGVLPEVLADSISEITEDNILSWQECVERATISPIGKAHRRFRFLAYSNYSADSLHLLTLSKSAGAFAHPALGTVIEEPEPTGLLRPPERTWAECCHYFSELSTWLRAFPCRGYVTRLVNLDPGGSTSTSFSLGADQVEYGEDCVLLTGPPRLVDEAELALIAECA